MIVVPVRLTAFLKPDLMGLVCGIGRGSTSSWLLVADGRGDGRVRLRAMNLGDTPDVVLSGLDCRHCYQLTRDGQGK